MRRTTHIITLRHIISVFTVSTLLLISVSTTAQVVDGWYISGRAEEQLNASNRHWNLSSLLDYGVDLNLWRGGQLNISAVSTYMQHEDEYLCDDPLVFSNIDAPSKLFRFSMLGLSQQIGSLNIFAGLRNSVTDFFADDELAIFLSSMHGIQPVISENFDIATYPTTSLCAQMKWDINEHLRITSAFYNSTSTDELDRIFYYDGIANITALHYHPGRRTLEIGAASGKDDIGSFGTAIYYYDIERIADKVTLIGEAGYFFGINKGNIKDTPDVCKFNVALGVTYTFNEKHALSLMATAAAYDEGYNDKQLEFNYALTLGCCTLHPAFVLDERKGDLIPICVLGLSVDLSSD